MASFAYFSSCPCLSLVYLVQVTCSCSVVTHKCISLSLCLIWSYERKWLTVNLYCLKNVICRKVVPAAAISERCFSRLPSFSVVDPNFWNEASKTLTSATTNSGYYFGAWAWVSALEQFGQHVQGPLLKSREQHYVAWVSVSVCRFTSECTLKFHLWISLIGVCLFGGVCLSVYFFRLFFLVCGIVSILYFWEFGWTRTLFEENERKMKACSFFGCSRERYVVT